MRYVLDTRVTLQQPTTTVNEWAEEEQSHADVCTVWADRQVEAGGERIRAGRTEAEQAGVYTIRFRSGIGQDWRLVDGATTWEVAGVREIGRRQYTEITVRRLS